MKLFHVEPWRSKRINKGIGAVVAMIFFCFSCVPMREKTTIPDYVIQPNGMQILGTKSLNAFIFEDMGKGVTFQHYLVSKFRKASYNEKEFTVLMNGTQFKILLYDNTEFEKYFQTARYIRLNSPTADPENDDRPAFIAMSMISDTNDDCLQEGSLFRGIAEDYLKNLKDEYQQYNEILRP